MKARWFMSIVALLAAMGAIGAGSAAQVEETTVSSPAIGEAPGRGTAAEALIDDAPSEAPDQSCKLDNCLRPHDPCTCSNTGWAGYCGHGPHHPGCLYCRCD